MPSPILPDSDSSIETLHIYNAKSQNLKGTHLSRSYLAEVIMDPPGVFIVFVTLLFFTITIHTATDKSADDVGNYYVELAET